MKNNYKTDDKDQQLKHSRTDSNNLSAAKVMEKLRSVSIQSLTASEVENTLMELMDIPTDKPGCGKICKAANPITASGKKVQLLRMLGIALVPILILLGFTGQMFYYGVSDSWEASKVRRTLRFSTELAEMLYNLQNERDMSALYVSDLSKDVPKKFLVENYPITDASINALSYWPAIKGDPHYASKEQFYNLLNRHRYELDTKQPTILGELNFYSDSIEVFINWLYSALTEAQSGTVWKDLVALVETVEALTSAGIERALGSLFYMNGRFPSRYVYLLFRKAQDVGDYTIKHVKDYSPVAARVYKNTIQNEREFFEVIKQKRDFIKAATLEQTDEFTNMITQENEVNLLNGSLAEAQDWFSNMTVYLDAILKIQKSLIAIINQDLEQQAEADKKILFIVAGLFFSVVVLSPIILRSVYVLTKQFQTFTQILAERSVALSKEKKRTEKMLYQMLPKELEERIKRNEPVNPEFFSDVSICVVTLVAFDRMCWKSCPNKMVNVLNFVIMNYDRIISEHDCCKIETMGSALMAASGVPVRNGKRHVVEIARFVLQFMEETHNLIIPRISEQTLRFRAGCYSGSCVAAVVQNDIARYCLLGEAVHKAFQMEDTSKSGKVQICEKTNWGLKHYGGFTTELRDTNDENGPSMTSYWLLGKDGEYEAVSSASDSEVQADFFQPSSKGSLTRRRKAQRTFKQLKAQLKASSHTDKEYEEASESEGSMSGANSSYDICADEAGDQDDEHVDGNDSNAITPRSPPSEETHSATLLQYI